MDRLPEKRWVVGLSITTALIILAGRLVFLSSGLIDTTTWRSFQEYTRCFCCCPAILMIPATFVLVLDRLTEKQKLTGGVERFIQRMVRRFYPKRQEGSEGSTASRDSETVPETIADVLLGRTTFLIAWGMVLFATALAIGIWFIILQGGGGPNARTAERVTREFISTLSAGEAEVAHGMLVDEWRLQMSPEELALLLEGHGDWTLVREYRSLEVCQFEIMTEEDARLLAAYGLLHHEGGTTVFGSWLQRGSNMVWQVYGFQLFPEEDTSPWGRCYFRSR